MPYVRLDERKGHFGPAWVCFEFSAFLHVWVALIQIRSRFGRLWAVYVPFSGRFPPKHAPGVPGFGHMNR
jgi:hypothetical protein